MARRLGTVRKVCGGLVGLTATLWVSALSAQPAAHLALSWSAPPGCPTADNVQARVDSLLGGEASGSSVADVRASGQVERVDNGFRLLLNVGVGSTPSSRTIEARTCDELAGAAAIAIALLARSSAEGASDPAVEGVTPASSVPAEHEDRPVTSAPTREEEASRKPEPPPETARDGLHFIVDAPVAVAGWGSLPSTGLGLGAGLGLRWRALRVAVGAELWRPQTARASGFASRFTLMSGRAEACVTHAMHGFELGPCLGAALQRLTGEGLGSGVFSATSKTTVWISGTGGLFASLPTPGFAHLRFFGGARVLVSPSRPRFVIDQLGPVHEPALAAPEVDLGCEWIF